MFGLFDFGLFVFHASCRCVCAYFWFYGFKDLAMFLDACEGHLFTVELEELLKTFQCFLKN